MTGSHRSTASAPAIEAGAERCDRDDQRTATSRCGRFLRLGLYGLVLAGLVGGTAAWVSNGKSVTLRIDGQDQTVHTSAADVAGVLKSAHIGVGTHDIVAPGLNSAIASGSTVVIRRGHLLHLTINGQSKDVWVNADSVSQALGQLGFAGDSYVSVSRSRRLDSGTTDLVISSPKKVTIVVDGTRHSVMSAGPTVYAAIDDAGITLGPNDRVSASGDIHAGQVITIKRVKYTESTKTESVPFDTVKRKDPNSYVGTDTVVRPGKNGTSKVTYQLIYVDGKYAGRVVVSSVALTQPVSQILTVGTRATPDFVSSYPVGSPQRIAAGMLVDRGWGSDQFSCLNSLWTKESNWRTDAANPSGAYGIPQALPGSKMSTVGSDWETNAATQITWGLNYISGVYGTPCAAWAHSQATNWY